MINFDYRDNDQVAIVERNLRGSINVLLKAPLQQDILLIKLSDPTLWKKLRPLSRLSFLCGKRHRANNFDSKMTRKKRVVFLFHIFADACFNDDCQGTSLLFLVEVFPTGVLGVQTSLPISQVQRSYHSECNAKTALTLATIGNFNQQRASNLTSTTRKKLFNHLHIRTREDPAVVVKWPPVLSV